MRGELVRDDKALHPEMDVAVIVVLACLSEGERVCPTVLRDIGVKRREAPVCCCIGRHRMQDAATVFPDNGRTVYRSVVRGRTEKTTGIWRCSPTCVVVFNEYVRRGSWLLGKDVSCDANHDQDYYDYRDKLPCIALGLRCFWWFWCCFHFFPLNRVGFTAFGIKVVSSIYIPIIQA
jgi:hypothetical protein